MKVKSDHRSNRSTNMNYFISVNFTSFHCTGRYELNKLTSLPMCGFIAQLVEHRTGIAEVTGSNPVEALNFCQASSFQLEVTGSNPVEALIFFRLLLSSCLNWKIYCDDHSSLSSMVFLVLKTSAMTSMLVAQTRTLMTSI